MATAYTALADAFFNEPGLTAPEIDGRLGYKLTAATIGTTSFTTTDPNIIKLGSQALDNRFNGWHVYFATAAEQRVITTISISGSTATVSFIGGNATTQAGATTAYITHGPTWAEIRGAFNYALEYIPCSCVDILRHGPDDAFMQANNTTSWTGSNCTVAKQTTATEVLHGQRSTSLTLTSGGGYATGTTVRIGQAEMALVQAIAKADIGTGIIRALDGAGNTIDSSLDVSFTQEQWLYMRKHVTVASDDEGIALRLLGTDSSDQIDVQAAWVVNLSENIFPLPSYIDDRFKLKAVARREYRVGGLEADTWLGKSYHDTRLQENVDYRFINQQSDANPLSMEMLTSWWRSYPIMLYADAPYSAPYGVDGTFSTDASTTTCPPHLLLARTKQWIGEQYPDLFPSAMKIGEREFKERSLARNTALPQLTVWRGPSRVRI